MNKALIISCFDWYEKRIRPVEEMLKNNNYNVKIAMSDFSHIEKKYYEEKYNHIEYIHVPHYKRNLSFSRLYSHCIFGKSINKILNEYKPDLIYLILPPNNTARYCLKYKKTHKNVKYIVDIIDMWPESFPVKNIEKLLIGKFWKKLRDNSLKYANCVYTECDLYKDKLKDVIDSSSIITNYLYKDMSSNDLEYIKKKISGNNYNNNIVYLGYLGSINYIIDIDGILNLVKNIEEYGYKVIIKIIGDGNRKDYFLDKLKENDIEYEYYGKIFDERKKIEILSKCNFGINLMVKNVFVGLTTKSIDYFSYGLPIISNIKGDTEKIVKKYKIGINYSGSLNKKEYETILNTDRNEIIQIYEKLFSKKNYENNLKKIMEE